MPSTKRGRRSDQAAAEAPIIGPRDLSDSVYELRGVTHRYGRGPGSVLVLDEIRATVRRGECVGVLGGADSGKTTLISVLGGRLRPTAGSLCFEGRRLESCSEHELADLTSQAFGVIPQRPEPAPARTVIASFEVDLIIRGFAGSEAAEVAEAHLEAIGLEAVAHKPMTRLTPEERKLVAIARAIAHSPRVVLADEPTAGLDPEGAERALSLLLSLPKYLGVTLILATRDEATARRTNRLLWLREGRLAEAR